MKCMRAAGVQIEALIEYVNLFQQGDGTIDARKELLKEQRGQLAAGWPKCSGRSTGSTRRSTGMKRA